MDKRTRMLRSGVIAATVVVLLMAEPVQGFYWRGWPGSGVIVAPLLVDPNEPTPGNPPVDPIPFPGTENNYSPPVGPPANVPEPATGLASLLGLGALAAVRRWRKKPS